MRYDDGFIAYLNGVEIARANAPSNATWDSAASLSHRDSEAMEFEEIDVTAYAGLLHSGRNVLAIHGLNRRLSDNDMLIQAELLVGEFTRSTIELHTSNPIVARTFRDGSWSGATVLNVAQPGDANGNGVFNSSDLVQVFQVGEYEDEIDHNSTWAEGDWSGDERLHHPGHGHGLCHRRVHRRRRWLRPPSPRSPPHRRFCRVPLI